MDDTLRSIGYQAGDRFNPVDLPGSYPTIRVRIKAIEENGSHRAVAVLLAVVLKR
jgi:hypothetical protein